MMHYLKDLKDIKEEILVMKQSYAEAASKSPLKDTNINIKTQLSDVEDKYVEERGKVGIYTIDITYIRRHANDDASDEDLVKSFSCIQARTNAAKEYLNKKK